jgi:hypothetical protein
VRAEVNLYSRYLLTAYDLPPGEDEWYRSSIFRQDRQDLAKETNYFSSLNATVAKGGK